MQENQTSDWKKLFATIISRLCGHEVKPKDIYSDTPDKWCITCAIYLDANHPLLMLDRRDFCPSWYVVIPHEEYQQLETKKLEPDTYIHNAFWNYGYTDGYCGFIRNYFWKPLENSPGIRDTEKVKRYLDKKYYCRNCSPTKQKCNSCNYLLGYINEPEPDYRYQLVKAVTTYAENTFNLEASSYLYAGEENVLVILKPYYSRYVADLYFPAKDLNRRLYHPKEEIWSDVARSYKLKFGVNIPANREQNLKSSNFQFVIIDTELKHPTSLEDFANIYNKLISTLYVKRLLPHCHLGAVSYAERNKYFDENLKYHIVEEDSIFQTPT